MNSLIKSALFCLQSSEVSRIPGNGSSLELNNETLLAMLADSVSEVMELEILKFNAVAKIVSGYLCNSLVLRLKATSLTVSFSTISIARDFLFLFQSKRQNLVCLFEVGAVLRIFIAGNFLYKIFQTVNPWHATSVKSICCIYCHVFFCHIYIKFEAF